MRVTYSLYAMGRMEEYWDKPLEFRPERWLGENNGIPIKANAFASFNAGPRTCLGRDMAYIEAKILVIMILRNFKLRLAPHHTATYQTGITLKAKNGMVMNVISSK